MYRARVGDIIEFEGYVGIIQAVEENVPNTMEPTTVKLDWVSAINPGYDYRSSHPDADWYPVEEWVKKFKLIGNVHDFS